MVGNPLLITKLAIPSSRKDVIARKHLLVRLDEGLARPLMLISAPAGSGKTTLVSTWARQSTIPVAWLSLDEADSDPSRFLAYLTAALSSVTPDLDRSVLPLLQSPQPQPIEVALTALINRLSEVPEPFVVVLDDYHLVDSSPVQAILAFLLDHLPRPMHLILISRADPLLPLARLRARGQLVELRAADLSFSLDESAVLLAGKLDGELAASDIEALLERTEGWAAGLHLAALSMQGRADPARFIASFTGSHEYIVDYLVDEVLSQQPEPTRRFLLETSILKQLCGPLCDAVTGGADGADMLATLERRNLFIVPLDSERRWYRYHRLFAEVLQQRLHAISGNQIAGLHRRASQWLAEQGHSVEAVRHAMAAGDDALAADLVAQAAEPLLMRSETATLLHWIEQLPEERMRERPLLCAYHAWCLLLSGQPLEAVEARLRYVEQFEPALAMPFRGFVAFYQGRLAEAHALAEQALKSLPTRERFLRSAAQWVLEIAGLTSVKLSDVDAHLLAMATSATWGQGTSPVMAIISLCHQGEMRMRQRQLYEARLLYEQALSFTGDAHGEPLPIAGMALMGLGGLAYEWNDLESAEKYLSDGIDLITRWGEIGALDGYLGLHLVERAKGNFITAREHLRRAKDLARRFDTTQADDIIVGLTEARLWIAEGDLVRVREWAEAHGLVKSLHAYAADLRSLSALDYHLRHHQLLILVRFWMAEQNFPDALGLLGALFASMDEHGWLDSRREIEVQILTALCLHALTRQEEALAALARALDLAEPGGYVRTFVQEGPAVAELLFDAATQGIHAPYARRLLASFAASPTAAPAPDATADWIEPLSERETEVLRLIADGLTNREIAERLYLAPTTVKVHARNIFGKLGAANRTQAVARARALGLLP